jgi:signal transduction histidine kinase
MLNQFVSRADGLMLQFAAPLPLMIFSWILLTRFVQVLDEAESLNVDLEHRVEIKRIELEKNFQKLQELEKKSVLVHERERIMRDMHDGMGGHLVSTLSMIEASEGDHEDISQSLRDALDDLRVMIDSLDPVDDDLTTVLGMYRSRIQPRLEQSNIKINWKVTDIPNIPDLGPEKVLQVLRILQEAISNIIKHANADQITVQTEEVTTSGGNSSVYVRISDDGKGMETMNVSGRGLKNMRRRAEQIGAELEIESHTSGTTVSLKLSLSENN